MPVAASTSYLETVFLHDQDPERTSTPMSCWEGSLTIPCNALAVGNYMARERTQRRLAAIFACGCGWLEPPDAAGRARRELQRHDFAAGGGGTRPMGMREDKRAKEVQPEVPRR